MASGVGPKGPSCVTLDDVASVTTLERNSEIRASNARLREAAVVHEMRLRGDTYLKIAKALKMSPSKATVLHREHLEQLRQLEALGALEANRVVQDERYEALLSGVWDLALTGDLAAVRECRAILDSITAREAKVTAMITKSDERGRSVTLIAEGSSESYIQALREMG